MSISSPSYNRGFQSELAFVSRMLDAGIIWLSLFLLRKYFQVESINHQLYVLPPLLAIIFYFLAAESFSLYRSFRLSTQSEIAKKIILSWGATILALFLIALGTKTSIDYSRLTMGCWFVVCPILLVLGHFSLQNILSRVRNQEKNQRTYAILGDSESAKNLPEKINQKLASALDVVLHKPEIISALDALSIEAAPLSGKSFNDFYRSEIRFFADTAKEFNLKAN